MKRPRNCRAKNYTIQGQGHKIQPLLYGTILSRAEQRLLKLYDKVKDAPFLLAQQEELAKFIEPIVVVQPSLAESIA